MSFRRPSVCHFLLICEGHNELCDFLEAFPCGNVQRSIALVRKISTVDAVGVCFDNTLDEREVISYNRSAQAD